LKRILDKGYVNLFDSFGTDLSVVNSARVSFNKRKEVFDDKDRSLVNFLIREGHTSPFRHAGLSLEIYAPLFVARQWWKYAVASSHLDDQNGWNESSRRYVTEDPEFYLPAAGDWRMAPENMKQGSGGPIDNLVGADFTELLENFYSSGEELYKVAMSYGIAPEQARLFLPAYGMYVRWIWTTSLQGALNFLDQRLDHAAQYEIQLYAQSVEQYVAELFPVVYDVWKEKETSYA
jgi:thymidylate synthase (FAD)